MRVAILDDWLDVARSLASWDELAELEELAVFTEHVPNEARVAELLESFDVVSIMRERTPFPRSLLERLPNLRLLVTTGGHNSSVDLEAAAELGILVSGTTGIKTDTPELAWGLVLALARDLPVQDRSLREGRWQTGLGTSLAGKRLGLLGLGYIGGEMARFGQAFGMSVAAWSPNLTRERASEVGVDRVSKEELLRTSDVVSIHLRLGARSRGLLGPAELNMMRPTALLINTSRGPIVDEVALIDALRRGVIGGAALDVFDEEPLPADHPLMELSNTVLTPHLGYSTREGFARYYQETVAAIAAFQAGAPIRVVHPRPD